MKFTGRAFTLAMALVVGPWVSSVGAQQMPTQTVDGRPSCATCEIVLERVFTVTDRGDTAAVAPHLGVVRDSRGRFYFVGHELAVGIVVFDSTGKLLARFGRAGEGPGEFPYASKPMIGKGDTIFVCNARKCAVFAPDYRFVRTFQFSQLAVPFNGLVFRNGEIALKLGADPALWTNPVHRFSTTGELLASFGYSPPIDDPRRCVRCSTSLGMGAAANGEDVWVAPAGRHELQLWSGSGQLKRRIVVNNSPWFQGWDATPSGDPGSRVRHIIDRSGVLFLFATEAKLQPGKAPPLPPNVKITAREAAVPRGNVAFSPIIEAIDVSTGKVLASLKTPGYISEYGGEYLVTVRDPNASSQLIDVWRISLRK